MAIRTVGLAEADPFAVSRRLNLCVFAPLREIFFFAFVSRILRFFAAICFSLCPLCLCGEICFSLTICRRGLRGRFAGLHDRVDLSVRG